MKHQLKAKILIIAICLLLSYYFFAQPINDGCNNAIDISQIFNSNCGDQLIVGSFDNIGATTKETFPTELTPIIWNLRAPQTCKNCPYDEGTVWSRYKKTDGGNRNFIINKKLII